ncbi:MAG: caspase family protein [Rikenellaceae bacterium]
MRKFLLLFLLLGVLSTVSFAQGDRRSAPTPSSSKVSKYSTSKSSSSSSSSSDSRSSDKRTTTTSKPQPKQSSSQRFKVGSFTYEVLRENRVTLVEYTPESYRSSGTIEIPREVNHNYNKYVVAAIGEEAFYANYSIKSVAIPSTVIYIGDNAFSQCSELRMVTIDSPRITIGDNAFKYCSELSHFMIAADDVNMGDDVFRSCVNLKHVECKPPLEPHFSDLLSRPQIALIDRPRTYESVAEAPSVVTSSPQVSTSEPTLVAAPSTTIVADVDQNIPQTSANNNNTFAVIIANENYANVSNVDYAARDGQMFAEYCRRTLGLPEKNIKVIEDATLGAIVSNVDWLHNVLKAYGGSAKAIFYYSGHGIPDPESGESYILPTDCPPNNFNVAYKLQDLYAKLGDAGGNVTFFIDACFSGTKRQGEALVAARGVAIKTKPIAPRGNSVVFSAAAGEQTAFAYDEKGHGIFTYFLLKKLQETKGRVSYGELADYIKSEVAKVAIVERSVSQTPTVTHTPSLYDSWSGWSLIK